MSKVSMLNRISARASAGVYRQAQKAFDYIRPGIYHSAGWEPLVMGSKGPTVWGTFGRAFQAKGTNAMPVRAVGYDHLAPKGMLAYGMGVAGPLLTAGMLYEGWEEDGFHGLRANLMWDIAANAAIARYGYGALKAGRVIPGKMGLAKQIGLMGRLGMAYGAAGVAKGVLGGGIIGTAGMFGAAALAARHGGKLGLVGLAGAGAASVGYGAYHVLKAGYNHTQAKKAIHTSGSMAAFQTQGAHTMRARAVSAIHKSHLNARSALGQEASFMHYPSRNYHSRYRVF